MAMTTTRKGRRATTRNLALDVPVLNPFKPGTAPLVLKVEVSEAPAPVEDLMPLYYRGVTYMMPTAIVRAPFPTFTFRHLDKVGIFALEGNRAKVLSSVQRAVASAIDAPSLIKIAAVAHSEDCPEEAMTALKKALKVAARLPEMQALVRSSAATLGYLLDA